MRKKRPPEPAKLSRPRLFDVLERGRLFDRMDESRTKRVLTSIIGPPGSGKSTLVASWLDARDIPGIWFQLDSGDEDLPTFFHYLREAARRRIKSQLPAMTPEYRGDARAFARRFFRQLFAGLPMGAVLVLDDYQALADDSRLHSIVLAAVDALAQGSSIVLISRTDLPATFARLVANRQIAKLGYADLKMSVHEAKALGQQHFGLAAEAMEAIQRHCEGWVAGLILMLERWRQGGSIDELCRHEHLQDVFNYFASEILDEESPEVRKILATVSPMPAISAKEARLLTGSDVAGQFLEGLHRRNLFVDKRVMGSEPVYQLHALFAVFLRHRADVLLDASEKIRSWLRAARLLDASDRLEQAFELYRITEAWDEAAQMVIAKGPGLIATGRWKPVLSWIEQFPPDFVTANPWLLYWWGASQIAVSPPAARIRLESACRVAAACGDLACELQAAAGIVESCCIEWHDFSPMDRWMPVLVRAMNHGVQWQSPDAELRALHALASALVYRDPGNALLEICIERIFETMNRATDPNLKLVSVCTLVNHGAHNFRPETGRRAMLHVEKLLDDPLVTAANKGAALFSRSWHYNSTGDLEAAIEAVKSAEAIGREEGLRHILVFAAFMGVAIDGARGRINAVECWVAVLQQNVNPARWYDRILSASAQAFLGMYSGNLALVLEHAPTAVSLSANGVVASHVQWRMPLAVATTEAGKMEEAERWIQEIEVVVERHHLHHYRPVLLALRSSLALQSGQVACADRLLAECLGLCRRHGYGRYLRWARRIMPELCGHALVSGMDADVVRALILDNHWPPPTDSDAISTYTWPSEIRVCSFGNFSLEARGRTIRFPRKSPKKPLALLNALICMGGANVPVQRLVDAVWPDEEGDAAHHAFSTTLYRLRDLLGANETIQVSGGTVSLDRSLVWSDVLAFESLVRSEGIGLASAQALLSLYRGPLLPAEDSSWAALARDRARGGLIRHVMRVGRALEDTNRFKDALTIYESTLNVEPLREPIHQGKIRCLISLGHGAEAIDCYDSMRDLLAFELGISPSAETEALVHQARAAAP